MEGVPTKTVGGATLAKRQKKKKTKQKYNNKKRNREVRRLLQS